MGVISFQVWDFDKEDFVLERFKGEILNDSFSTLEDYDQWLERVRKAYPERTPPVSRYKVTIQIEKL